MQRGVSCFWCHKCSEEDGYHIHKGVHWEEANGTGHTLLCSLSRVIACTYEEEDTCKMVWMEADMSSFPHSPEGRKHWEIIHSSLPTAGWAYPQAKSNTNTNWIFISVPHPVAFVASLACWRFFWHQFTNRAFKQECSVTQFLLRQACRTPLVGTPEDMYRKV